MATEWLLLFQNLDNLWKFAKGVDNDSLKMLLHKC